MSNPLSPARWIWLSDCGTVNQYVDFRRTFLLPETHGKVTLYVSADSRYALYLNGTHVPASQYADYPEHKVYDTVDVTALVYPGENVLAIVGYYQGEDSSTYRMGQAGLCFALLPEHGDPVYSDSHTLCRQSLDYSSGEVERLSMQLSFSFRYDATKRDGWQLPTYTPGDTWQPAYETDRKATLSPRPIAPLCWETPRQTTVISQGVFWDSDSTAPCGERMQTSALAFRLSHHIGLPKTNAYLPCEQGYTLSAEEGDGIWLLLDLGGEESGVPELELELPHEATVLIGYSEHLEDGRVRSEISERQFSAVYHAAVGRQRFTHYFKRFGGRYMQLHIFAHRCTLYYAGVRPTPYPLHRRPAFRCADKLHEQIYQVSCRTLELCMHEHYEDTPWREQALYAMDSRIHMLCGYYAFGETRFAKASLQLLAQGIREDGLLELCAPARVPITIPSFSLHFISAVWEYVQFSKDTDFGKEMLPTIQRVLEAFSDRKADNGLVPRLAEHAYWNFYEWRPGLDGNTIDGNLGPSVIFDAPLNGFLAMAYADAVQLCQTLGYTQQAAIYQSNLQQLRRAMQVFWDDERKMYASFSQDGQLTHYCELTQVLCLCADVVDEQQKERLLTLLTQPQNALIPISLSFSIFKYIALMQEPAQNGRWVMDNIAHIWGKMLYSGATSFWETDAGASDFSRAGSLCHGWAAVPIYVYCRYVLGEQLDGTSKPPAFCGLYEVRREEPSAT